MAGFYSSFSGLPKEYGIILTDEDTWLLPAGIWGHIFLLLLLSINILEMDQAPKDSILICLHGTVWDNNNLYRMVLIGSYNNIWLALHSG